MHVTISIAILFFLTFAGCGIRHDSAQAYLAQRGLVSARAGSMTVCSGFGCARRSKVQLTSRQLLYLNELFSPRPVNAEQEREVLACCIAWLERAVGVLAGTQGDLAKNRRDHAAHGQLDCIAETVNTTLYLLLLQDRGLLTWHRVGPPENRGSSVFTAHNTAVIIDAQGREFAVDSWFHANGELPEVIDLPSWRNGFAPDGTKVLPCMSKDTDIMEGEHGI